ncbi:hypothetical protein ACB092_07G140900 [Castanea dentata]
MKLFLLLLLLLLVFPALYLLHFCCFGFFVFKLKHGFSVCTHQHTQYDDNDIYPDCLIWCMYCVFVCSLLLVCIVAIIFQRFAACLCMHTCMYII